MIKDLLEPLRLALESQFGLTIAPIWVNLAVIASFIIVVLLGAYNWYLWIRRNILKDRLALPDEHIALFNLIATDVHKIKDQLSATFKDELGEALRSMKENNDNAVSTAEDDVNASPTERQTKALVAARIRDAVIEQLMQGGWFIPSLTDHHHYSFRSQTTTGRNIRIELTTPYRKIRESDGHLDYVLLIWADGSRVFNFEWSYGGPINRRWFKVGDWVEEIVEWRFHKQPLENVTTIAAE